MLTKTTIQPSIRLAILVVFILAICGPSNEGRRGPIDFSPSFLAVKAQTEGGIPELCFVPLVEMKACVNLHASRYLECVSPEIDLDAEIPPTVSDFLAVYVPPDDPVDCFDMMDPICPASVCFTPCRTKMLDLYKCRVMQQEFFQFDNETFPMTRGEVEECFPMECEDYLT
jgi:hypothetical protein